MLPGAIDEALRCKEEGVGKTIPFNLCGHGHFDMQAYMAYQTGLLRYGVPEEVAMALAGLPVIDGSGVYHCPNAFVTGLSCCQICFSGGVRRLGVLLKGAHS